MISHQLETIENNRNSFSGLRNIVGNMEVMNMLSEIVENKKKDKNKKEH